jgi:hypothetical protein
MALYSEGAKPDTDSGFFNVARARFWAETEMAFYGCTAAAAAAESPKAATKSFLQNIAPVVRRLFNEHAPIVGSDHPARIAGAAKYLDSALSGYGKSGIALFDALGLPKPDAKQKGKAA